MPDEGLAGNLKELTELFLDRFIDQESMHLNLFFDEKWNLKSDVISFGHDIETAWLLTEAGEVLGDEALQKRIRAVAVRIAGVTLAEGVDPDGGLLNEAGPGGLIDTNKIWWPQAEAMVGFFTAWQISGEERRMALEGQPGRQTAFPGG